MLSIAEVLTANEANFRDSFLVNCILTSSVVCVGEVLNVIVSSLPEKLFCESKIACELIINSQSYFFTPKAILTVILKYLQKLLLLTPKAI